MNDGAWDTAVYVFCAVDSHGNFSQPCKIGVGKNPSVRIAGIQTSCPFKIEPFFFVRAPNRQIAFIVEGMAHDAFSDHAAFGEWFNITPADAAIGVLLLMKEALEHLNPPPGVLEELLEESGMTDAMRRLWPLRSMAARETN